MRACSGAQFPTDFPTDFEKYGGIFEIFARESIKYRRKLMPPPKKLLLYFPSAILSEILCYKTLPPLLDSFLLGSSFHLLFSSPCVLSFCKSFYCCVGSFQHIKKYVFFFLYLCIVCFYFNYDYLCGFLCFVYCL
jgi:hypothetical protein